MQNIDITPDEINYIVALCQAELMFLEDYIRNITGGVSTSTSYLDDISVEDIEERLKVIKGLLDKIRGVK